MQTPEYRPLTVGDWLLTKFILVLPFAGFIMLLVWAFSDDTHPSKKSFCQSTLIIMGVLMGLGILFMILFGGLAAIMGHALQQHAGQIQ